MRTRPAHSSVRTASTYEWVSKNPTPNGNANDASAKIGNSLLMVTRSRSRKRSLA